MDRFDIKALREKHGLSRSELANRLGIAYRTVQRWDNEHMSPSPMAIKQLKTLKAELERESRGKDATIGERHTDEVARPLGRRAGRVPASVVSDGLPKAESGPRRRVAHLPGDSQGEERMAPLAAVLPSMGRS